MRRTHLEVGRQRALAVQPGQHEDGALVAAAEAHPRAQVGRVQPRRVVQAVGERRTESPYQREEPASLDQSPALGLLS